jgi:FAD/FMN-containing dehydrogenase
MRGLKGIALSEDSQSVTVSVGETWTTLYEELEKHGLTTAGGRVGRVGVGGLVLGGPYSKPQFQAHTDSTRRSVLLLDPPGLRM